jgi:hypothetical protein
MASAGRHALAWDGVSLHIEAGSFGRAIRLAVGTANA